ncbi:Y-family DNA polymerase [Treponema sp.]|uniref:Y-family DNA polymerase n=1 Tax=Treponema sp. TaxID=166 RepID=UPI00298E55A4|nr:Y-family DNA polymerase [Treponema sp.]MCR5614256.1 Y-family DNA polymerase [Treponema sp.]
MILHADGNSFYASCEQIYRPDLRGKPVAVLSNNDGIIIALNKEAKACGIKRGDPYFKVRGICEREGIAIFSSNYTLYADISRRITSIYMEFAPDIEEYSIDESFLFFDDCNWSIKDYEQIGHDLKRRIAKEVGIPICVGAAPTKTLAKLYNKKAKEHGGVFVYDSREVDSLLEATDCAAIWGIGPARAKKLKLYGIKNALMLKHLPLRDAKRLLTIQGFATVQELNGIRSIDKVVRSKKEVITSSRQFSVKVYDIETIECAMVEYTELAVERLRKQKCECQAVQVTISTCNYYSDDTESQYSNAAIVELPRLTSYTPDIVNAARLALPHIFRSGYGYKVVMITLLELMSAQGQLWIWIDPVEDIKKRNLMNAVDRISDAYGRHSLTLARSYTKDGWQMKREFLSPCVTTDIGEVPGVG